MKKEIVVCDKCGREIHKGEQYVQRPKDLHSNRVSDIQDICRKCAYKTIGNNAYCGNFNEEYKLLFSKAINEEFWNIL